MSLTLLLTNRMLIITALTVIRPIAAGMATPFFGGNLIQGSMKRAVSITVALIAIPRVSMDASAGLPSDAIELAVIIVKEVFLGFTWGFAAAKSYNVALTVGAFIDNQRGATIANVINPATSEESSLFGDMFQQIFLLMFFASGGLQLYLAGFYESYRLWPVLTYFPTIDGRVMEYFLGILRSLALMTVTLAMPVIAAMFICEFGLGLINRSAQQLNVFFLALPLKCLAAIFVITMYCTILMRVLLREPAAPLELFDILPPEPVP